MKLPLSTFFAGLLFGIGLTISQMVNPAKIVSFLDITGNWDPSLAFVMGGALFVTFLGYKFVLKATQPLFADSFRLPIRKDIDPPLIMGAGLFGIGWGLSGLCPGPAISSLSFAGYNGMVFITSMIGSIIVFRVIQRRF